MVPTLPSSTDLQLLLLVISREMKKEPTQVHLCWRLMTEVEVFNFGIVLTLVDLSRLVSFVLSTNDLSRLVSFALLTNDGSTHRLGIANQLLHCL
jgi:hypothetical protein